MQTTTQALVLSKIKYNDNDLIVTCFTQQHGLLSFLLRGILKKSSANKVAYFQLLSQVQLVFNFNPKKSLHFIKDAKPYYVYKTLHTHVLKSAIVMFLAEVLHAALKEEEQNADLFSYIETSLCWLDEQDDVANFHLFFLLKLTQYLGFYPNISTMHLPYFNLNDGYFLAHDIEFHSLDSANVVLLKAFLNSNFENFSAIKINAKQRQSFLLILITYFELHLGGFKRPKSLLVLNQVFS